MNTITFLNKALESRQLSAEELTKIYLKNIEEKEDFINAYITVDEKGALEKARQIDKKRKDKEILSPLAGIPIGIKDNLCTKDIRTTCASKMLENFTPHCDATAVQALEDAGAIILGKLNMDEFAMGGAGENSYFKPTRNPVNTEYVAGGSSSGSAAAVGADEAVFTLGSDTGGSIRLPAAYCGVVGLKPSYGIISRHGLIDFATSFDQVGPITKDITDMSVVMEHIVHYDPKDTTSVKMTYKHNKASFDVNRIQEGCLKSLKIAIPKQYFENCEEETREILLKVAKNLEGLGASLEEISTPLLDYAVPAYYLLSSVEASSNLERFDGLEYGYRAKHYTDLESLYINSRTEAFGQEVKKRILLGNTIISEGKHYYEKALKVRTLMREEFGKRMKEYAFMLIPTTPSGPPKVGAEKHSTSSYLQDIYNVGANMTGFPALSLPCGLSHTGLPVGVQIMAGYLKDQQLLELGYIIEQVSECKMK